MPDLLEQVTRTAFRLGVKFALFEPRPPIQHELYQERPYAVTLRGGYHQTAMFLADVSSLAQIIKPSGMSMVRESREGLDEGETLTAELTLTTYLMVASPSQATQQERK